MDHRWVVSFVVITVLFAFIFKVLPQVPVHWGDVTLGAVVTALLFTAGKVLLGVYLGKADFTDTYGAAGSLVIVLVWVYIRRRCFIWCRIHAGLRLPFRLHAGA